MRFLRGSAVSVLIAGILFSICSCDTDTGGNRAEKTALEPSLETTSVSTATVTPDLIGTEEEGFDQETVRIDIDEPLLGFEGCYVEGINMYWDYYDWTFHNAEGEIIGHQFGYGYETPEYYLLDFDGDGNEELICQVQYGADLSLSVLIFRNNNGTVEESSLNEKKISNRIGESLYVTNHLVIYDPDKKLIVFEYYDGLNGESFPLKPDDFFFYEIGSERYDPFEPDFDDWKTETVVLSSNPLLGIDNWYCEKTYNSYGFTCWDFYSEDGVLFAKQFGNVCEEKPLIYIKDLDGDGKDELISECYYSDSGQTHYFVYRNDNGVIECGFLDPVCAGDIIGDDKITLRDYYEDYDKKNDRIVICYLKYDRYYEVTIEDLTFEEGDPTDFFYTS